MRLDACNKRIQRKLDDALYIQNIKDALECTLPYDIAVSEGEKYLSNEEMSCMNNILVSKSENCVEVNQCFEALLRINNEREKNRACADPLHEDVFYYTRAGQLAKGALPRPAAGRGVGL